MPRFPTIITIAAILLAWAVLLIAVLVIDAGYSRELSATNDSIIALLLSEFTTRIGVFALVITVTALAMIYKLVQREFKAQRGI